MIASVRTGLKRNAMAARTVWTILSQGFSSISNVVIVVLAARALSVDGFAELSVGLAVYSIWIGLARSLFSDPLMINYSAAASGDALKASRAAMSGAIALTLLPGALLVVLHVAGVTFISPTLAALGAVMPLVIVQDLLRHVSFVVRRPAVATLMDVLWVALVIAGVGFLPDHAWPAVYLAGWGIGAGVSAALGLTLLRALPGRGARAQLRFHRTLSTSATVEFLCLAGCSQAVILVVAGLGEPALAAGIRAAGVLLGPVGVLANGAHAVIVAEGSRVRSSDTRRLRHVAIWVPAGIAAAIVALAGALSLLPDRIGTAFLGDSWGATAEVMVRYGIVFGGLMAAFELGAVLRALDHTERAVKGAVPMFVGSMVAAFLLTSRGSSALLLGLTVTAWGGVGIYGFQVWTTLRQVGRRNGPDRSAPSVAEVS